MRRDNLHSIHARMEFRILSEIWKAGPQLQQKNLQEYLGNTDVLTNRRNEVLFLQKLLEVVDVLIFNWFNISQQCVW